MLEIDGVRNELHTPIWESGDYISDEYLMLIDLSTSEFRTTEAYVRLINNSIRGLNRNIDTTSAILVGTDLAQLYDDVIGQLNEINVDIIDGEPLRPLNYEDSRFAGSSGSYRWVATS